MDRDIRVTHRGVTVLFGTLVLTYTVDAAFPWKIVFLHTDPGKDAVTTLSDIEDADALPTFHATLRELYAGVDVLSVKTDLTDIAGLWR